MYTATVYPVPMALAGGGSFTTVKPSQHSRTGAEVIARFLDVRIGFEEKNDACHLVTVAA